MGIADGADKLHLASQCLHVLGQPTPFLDIAEYLGFNDQSAFQRAFKRWEGITPGQFRNQQRLS